MKSFPPRIGRQAVILVALFLPCMASACLGSTDGTRLLARTARPSDVASLAVSPSPVAVKKVMPSN